MIVPMEFDESKTYKMFREDDEIVGIMLMGNVIAWKRAYESEN